MYTDQTPERNTVSQIDREATRLEDCKDRAGQAAAAIESALSRIERLRQKLEGTDRPQEGKEPTPVPNGLIDEIAHIHNSSCKNLDLISMELDTLERMI